MSRSLDIATPYASFDVFDTLVCRACGSPRGVFACVERRALAEGVEAEDFAARRVEAERRAIERVGAARMKLADIYAELATGYGEPASRLLMEMEERAEVDLCLPVADMVAFLRECVDKCEAVVLVSDMYLPSSVIERMLERCGAAGYTRLYVSCEHGKTKAGGGLFEDVLADLGAEPGQVTHFGDSLKGDVLAPRRLGMRSVAVREGRPVPMASAALDRVAAHMGRARQVPPTRPLELAAGGDIAHRAGYSVLGPVLVALCEWVHRRRGEDGLDGLHFVARDGWVMRRCYAELYPEEETGYLLASRRSTTVPMLWRNPGIEGFVRTVGLGREMTAGEILMRLGLGADEAGRLEAAHGLDGGTRLLVAGLGGDARFAPLFAEAEPEVLENSRREFRAMRSYMRGELAGERAIGLVDLGWRGSIQHALETALPEMGIDGACVEGLYFGIDPESRWAGSQDMRGFLFGPGRDEELAYREKWFNALVEALFSAPHGTVVRYVGRGGGGAEAELAPREEGNDDSSPFFAIQDAAMDFARDYRERSWGAYGLFGRDAAVGALCRLGLRPTREEASFLGDVVFAYQEATPLARPAHGLGWYLVHPRALAADLNVCYWKPAFLTRIAGSRVSWWRLLAGVKRVVRRGEG